MDLRNVIVGHYDPIPDGEHIYYEEDTMKMLVRL